MAKEKILLIEDDLRLASVTKQSLEEQGFVVEVAEDGQNGLNMALSGDYQIIISDILLPGLDGLELCRKLRSEKPKIPILMLTALGTTDNKLEGFDAGADDYLVKPFEIRELTARVKALLKRTDKSGEEFDKILRFSDLEVDLDSKVARRGNNQIKLTPKEFNLLVYLMRNPRRVLSRDEISEKVWDTYFDTGTNFIDVYINYLRKKVDKPFSNPLIHTRPGMGFILDDTNI